MLLRTSYDEVGKDSKEQESTDYNWASDLVCERGAVMKMGYVNITLH